MPNRKIYNLRIVPPIFTYNAVVDFKTQFIKHFGKQMYSKSKPHITIAAFVMQLGFQDQLISTLNKLSSLPKFPVEINGFGTFEGRSNVLLLKIAKSRELKELYHQVNDLYCENLYQKLEFLSISNHPHMTLSKTGGKKMLYKSLAYFSKMDYHTTFIVDHLTLVARYDGRTWDWEHRIPLS